MRSLAWIVALAAGCASTPRPVEEETKQQEEGAKKLADQGIKSSFHLRFFERIATADHASERGIWESILTMPDGQVMRSYGKFHVISRKEGDKWRILTDYGSTEDGTIGEADFRAASALDYARD